MKRLLALFIALNFAFLTQAFGETHKAERISVVELYTSQGCSSCPPADAFLGELAQRPDVLALAFHVDYWDYIGWDDPFAQATFSNRQRDYARSFNLRYIYTPQMVVNGTFETSGTNKGKVLNAIARDLEGTAPVDFYLNNNTITASGPKHDELYNVWLVEYIVRKTTEVKRGENRGRTLNDYHIVTSMEKIGQWSGGTNEYRINSLSGSNKAQAIFLQSPNDNSIIAAFKLD